MIQNPYPKTLTMIIKRYHLNKFQILNHAENTISDITEICRQMDDHLFFYKSEQWSAAENLEHLSLTLYRSWFGIFTPKFLLKWKFGKPMRSSSHYEELENEYYNKIEEGYQTEARYIPVIREEKGAKEKLIQRFEQIAKKYLDQVRYYWEDENMDNYQLPHPVLGMITVRELLYFNLFHNTHHYKTIRNRKNEAIEFSVAD
ncbi:MAG: DinB family protein [Lacibacter sp.]